MKIIRCIKINGQKNNIGTGREIEISWEYADVDFMQESFKLQISGKDMNYSISSRGASNVFHADRLQLCSNERYDVMLTVSDGKREYKKRTFFETAMLSMSDFTAKWIEGGVLVRNFAVREYPVSAKLMVTGLGYYHCYLNSRKVGDLIAAPAYTSYRKAVEYQVFDVKDYLQKENVLCIVTGSHYDKKVDDNRYFNASSRAFCEMILRYFDGREERIVSDSQFKVAPETPFISTSVYNGETFDSRRLPGFSKKIFDTKEWRPAQEISFETMLFPQQCPGVRIKRHLAPKEIWQTGENTYTLDFGVNISGVVRMRGNGKSGAKVTVRHAELIDAFHKLDTRTCRIAKATDTYIFRGADEEEYMPYFTYHGFRYAEVQTEGVSFDALQFMAEEVSSDLESASQFHCSSAQIDRIHQIMTQTLSNNLYSIPTDCHQRDERQGWLGDAQVACPAVMIRFDAKQFYKNYLEEVARGQSPDGGYRELCAPAFFSGTTLLYAGAFYMFVDDYYQRYKDVWIIRKYYDRLKAFFRELETHETEKGIDIGTLGVGDWLGQFSSENHACFAAYCNFCRVLLKFARLIGEQQDISVFEKRFRELKDKYNRLFYYTTPNKDGHYGDNNEQCQYLNASTICYGLEADGEEEKIHQALAWDVEFACGKPTATTGLMGTGILFDALQRIGRNDLALELFLKKDYPSYGFMLSKGATTVWEKWQYLVSNNMNSHCHPPLAAPLCWLYEGLCGIRLSKTDENGRAVFLLRPFFTKKLSFVSGSVTTVFGKIKMQWKRKGDKFCTQFQVPANVLLEFAGEVYGYGKHIVTVGADGKKEGGE